MKLLFDSPESTAPPESLDRHLRRAGLRIGLCLAVAGLTGAGALGMIGRADSWGPAAALLFAGLLVRAMFVLRSEIGAIRAAAVAPVEGLLSALQDDRDCTVVASTPLEFREMAAAIARLQATLRSARDAGEARQAESAYQTATLRRLLELSREFTSSLDLEYVLGAIAAGARSFSGFEEVRVWLTEGEHGRLKLARLLGDADPTRPRTIELGEGLAGRAALFGNPQVKPSADHAVPADAPTDRILSDAALPMTAAGKIIGVIELSSSAGRVLPREMMTTLQTLAGQGGNAIEAAQLYLETQKLSQTDALTHLHNRRRLDEDLAHETSRSARYKNPLAFVLFDVDHFKAYNDANGHQAGDAVLQEIAALLSSSMRSTDSSYRYGGEEFAVLLRETTLDEARLVTERLRGRIESQFAARGESPITASFGIAAVQGHATSATELIKCADEALYAAKSNGRNRVESSRPAITDLPANVAVLPGA
ncbi:MAG: diguanylate cyclase [Actinomycetota bacterium]